MKVLIVGSGGREHALAWKIAKSPKLTKLYIAPGNPGTAEVGENVDIKVTDISGLVEFAKTNRIDLTVIGPDDVLAAGAADAFNLAGLKVFGPSKSAAKIEWSKAFAKDFMAKHDVPTARFKTFDDYELAKVYLDSQAVPIVIKASGLALGKGVTVCRTLDEAQTALRRAMVEKAFGESGSRVVIEECLTGEEVSIHAICDGDTSVMFPVAQDHKPIFDGNKGPNTGGMGTYAPVPWVDDLQLADIKKEIVDPVVNNMPGYIGCLYPGLMGDPLKVIEYNARFGDPEIQSYVRLLASDLLEIIEAAVSGHLVDIKVEWRKGSAICVVMASGGYPGKYDTGILINGIDEAQNDPDVVVFQAGTSISKEGLLTAGGRVLNVTAYGDSLKEAVDKAYRAVNKISFEGMQYRKDIAAKALS
jgi:phosphoribosylamine---glycine ligase